MLSHTPARPASIRVFLADGRADGLRLVEKSNWTGLGLVCARTDYPRVRTREEWSRPGVYLLVGPRVGEGVRDLLYVGEADDVRDRVDNHMKGKDFWTTVIAFTSKDANLNKAHVRHLEARLLQLAVGADRVDVTNSTAPAPPPLSEADRADMEAFLEEMLVVVPLLGISAFEPIEQQAARAPSLRLVGKGAVASGADTADGFVVAAGSLARIDEVPSIHSYLHTLRVNLQAIGVLVPDGDRLRFSKPYLFDSPSTAAGVVLGRSANGRIVWKDSTGRTLKALQEQALGPS